MKNLVKMYLAAALILLIGIVVLVFSTNSLVSGKSGSTNEIISTLNNIAVTAEEKRSNLSVLDEKNFGVDYVIIDLADNVLYSSPGFEESNLSNGISLEKAMKKRFLYKSLTENGRIWGNVIIIDDGLTNLKDFRNKLITGAIICVLLMLIGMIAFTAYVNRNVIAPFKNLKDFAARVAQGQLDEPLQMDRNN
nr:hypothetical protein [Eubacterium sp.]